MKKRSETSAVLVIEGQVNINHAKDFCTLLREKIGKSDRLTLNIKDLESMDPAILQVLLSLQVSLKAAGKTLHFHPTEFPPQVADLVSQLGLTAQLAFGLSPQSPIKKGS